MMKDNDVNVTFWLFDSEHLQSFMNYLLIIFSVQFHPSIINLLPVLSKSFASQKS